MNEQSGWSGYEKLVLNRLDKLDEAVERLEGQVTLTRIDIATLKVKAGMWGAVAGLVPALITAIVAFVGVH